MDFPFSTPEVGVALANGFLSLRSDARGSAEGIGRGGGIKESSRIATLSSIELKEVVGGINKAEVAIEVEVDGTGQKSNKGGIGMGGIGVEPLGEDKKAAKEVVVVVVEVVSEKAEEEAGGCGR